MRDTPQVILDPMTPVLSFYHMRGLKQGLSHTHSDTHSDGIRIIYITDFLRYLKKSAKFFQCLRFSNTKFKKKYSIFFIK
jgi:hypothetical protein